MHVPMLLINKSDALVFKAYRDIKNIDDLIKFNDIILKIHLENLQKVNEISQRKIEAYTNLEKVLKKY